MTCAIPVEHCTGIGNRHDFFSGLIFTTAQEVFFYVKGKRPGFREEGAMSAEQLV